VEEEEEVQEVAEAEEEASLEVEAEAEAVASVVDVEHPEVVPVVEEVVLMLKLKRSKNEGTGRTWLSSFLTSVVVMFLMLFIRIIVSKAPLYHLTLE